MSAEGLPEGTRLQVVRGNPTAAEVAAILLAVDQAAAADAAGRQPPRRPAWQTAARLESLGRAPLASASDLRARS